MELAHARLRGEARHADLIEHTLYNAVLPGLSLDGQNYFYQNPLADDGTHRRQPWFGCACCPPNVARLLASLPGYFYSTSEDAVWVHLYAEGVATVELDENRTISLRQRTRYPWDGRVEITVEAEAEFALMLRIPAWCEEGAVVEVNGEPVDAELSSGSYAKIRYAWRPGDTIILVLPMPVRRVECHPYVVRTRDASRYEGPFSTASSRLTSMTWTYATWSWAVPSPPPALSLNCSEAWSHCRPRVGSAAPDTGWEDRLYRTAYPREADAQIHASRITAVPYYAWANREPGAMRVWLRDG